METCRMVLLAIVWIFGISEMIGGIAMITGDSDFLRLFGIAAIIVSILGSIIGHFLVNVVLAIPFILLNNGDYLAAIVPEGKHIGLTSNLEFIPTHRVKLITDIEGLKIRKEPIATKEHITKIPNGTEVQHINTGGDVFLNDIKGQFFEIVTRDGIRGWCFSGHLEKI